VSYNFLYTLPTITGSHTGMPLVIKTADFPAVSLDGTANAILNGGGDLRAYTDSGKGTQLPLDIVTLVSSGSANAVVWVRIPTAATGTTIYFETHESETTQPAVAAAFGRNAVWVDYEAVLHLRETGDGTAGEYVDSTGNGHHGQLTIGTSPPSAVSTNHPFGDVWSGLGNTHAISLASTAALVTGGDFNFSIFYNATLLNNAKGLFGNRYDPSTDYCQMKLNGQVRVNGAGDETVGGTQAAANTTSKMQADVGTGTIEFFQDGVSKGTDNGQTLTTDGDFRIGTYFDASSERFVNGNVCEARIRKSLLGAAWITAEYANQTGNGDWASSGAWTETTSSTTKTATLAIQAETATIAMTANVVSSVNNIVVEHFCIGTGTSTTHLEDSNDSANDLLINYQTDKAEFISDATGTGINFTADPATSGAAYAQRANAKDNGTIATKLNGVTKLCIMLYAEVIDYHNFGSRIFHFGEDSGNGILGVVFTTSGMQLRWNNAASGQEYEVLLPSPAKQLITINVDTSQAVQADRVEVYYGNVKETQQANGISLNSALAEMTSTSGSFVVGNRGSANRGVKANIRYLFIETERNFTTGEIADANTALTLNDDIDWQTPPPVQIYSAAWAKNTNRLIGIH